MMLGVLDKLNLFFLRTLKMEMKENLILDASDKNIEEIYLLNGKIKELEAKIKIQIKE